ncbi:FKBP-type peptidyl-prolyl cis-trans isomerase [Pseudofulvimonas gallinarii]|uniref:Peptidyl-prolyl cis-trans isomerase n=1 Tax=Pseudofulvimonas gallinarii TaxID=634155 RepID=A0A4R3LMW2_9GAMM|nr:peptidylprolyl isomerase [Pseudofulvimonas gallinarii]TCT01401.1 FKBP-type peptidyl prolyl cis-trans isomerase /apo-metallochaperone SlyD [Pseudofulvimonas gallinarii]THD15151.1 peptidylprolyl isomerase [Pseudofulvimonas gallinarii]
MQVAKDCVVRFHYTLKAVDGTLIESSEGAQPLAILWGHGGLIAGVERALEGRSAGDSVEVTVSPEDGYGERRDDLFQRLPKKYFRNPDKLRPGMVTEIRTERGPRVVTVVKTGMTVIDVDGNHPLAGQTLQFALQVVDVREATAEEIDHGHVHGDGGHHH